MLTRDTPQEEKFGVIQRRIMLSRDTAQEQKLASMLLNNTMLGRSIPQEEDKKVGIINNILLGRDNPQEDKLAGMLQRNKAWARKVQYEQPNFFSNSAKGQSPKILWIGCSDSRVPAEQIVQCAPGDLFVHRNIANLCLHTDMNCLSVLQYAVDVLKVEHIVVCGHYGCGGVKAAIANQFHGLIDSWLCNIKDVYRANRSHLEAVEDISARQDLLVELNVGNTVHNVCHSPVVQAAWERNQPLSVHAWCYGLEDGLIRELGLVISKQNEVEAVYKMEVIDKTLSTKASESH